MYRKSIILIIAALVIAAISDFNTSAEDIVRQSRLDILNNMKAATKIQRNNRRYETEHFNVFIDDQSLESYGVDSEKKLQAVLLRLCYVLEEAHAVVERMTNEETHGEFDIHILAPEIFMKKYQNSEPYYFYFTGSIIWLCLPPEAMDNPLGDFGDNIGSLYRVYMICFIYSKWGLDSLRNDSEEFEEYFGEIGQATSKWNNTLTDNERQQIINEIDRNHTFLFKKYPEVFINKEVNKKYMERKWCHKEIDITGIRKNTRIKCPHCNKTITVE
jgi:hypothetical protein